MAEIAIPKGGFGVTEAIPLRKIGPVERLLGPETYRIVVALLKTPVSILGFALIAFFIVVALAAPWIAPPLHPNNPYDIPRDGFRAQPQPMMSEWNREQPPLPAWWKPIMGTDQWVHLLGTSEGQYDLFYGIVWGTRTAFKTGLIVTFVTLIIGIVVGSVSAYYGGATDNIIMRGVDIMLTLPFILAALILAAVLTPKLGRSLLPATIALIAFGWMGYSRIIRGDILSVKQRDYVMAARVIGVKDSRILMRHIIPNAIFPTLVLASLAIGDVVLSFAALSFLGIGTPVGYADWGQTLSFARNWITDLSTYWYIVVWPGMTLVLFVMGWNLVGDALRDVFDPRMRGRGGA
ncbi:MAG TPA: ABC transporter permease [Anaerolineales bacterium]|nr:ABC transporter permease [Anaerolineales bacterium]